MGICTIVYIIVGFIALIFSFIDPMISWIIIFITIIFQLITLWVLKKRFHIQEVPELSEEANIFVNKYAYFYLYPFACNEHSIGSSIVRITSVLIALIGIISKFWIGIIFGIVIYIIMPILEKSFKPTIHLKNEFETEIQKEISSYISRKQFEDLSDNKTT